MGRFEDYAFEVLSEAFGDRWSRDDTRLFAYGFDAGQGSVDGMVDGRMAVEIGVGSPKQARSGLLDLVLHPAPLKLLVLVDTPHHPTDRSQRQAQAIMDHLDVEGQAVRLSGNPAAPQLEVDAKLLCAAYDSFRSPRR